MSFIALNKLFEEEVETKEKALVKAEAEAIKERRKSQRERLKKERMLKKKLS